MDHTCLMLADADRKLFCEAADLLKENHIEVVYGDPHKVSKPELIAQAKGIETVIAGSENWSEDVMKQCPDLRLIVRCGTGYDGVDIGSARELGIKVGNTPGLNTYAVAEMAMTLILNLVRKTAEYQDRVKRGIWGPLPVRELRGKTIGLLGFGAIAKQLARLMAPYECRILAYDIVRDERTALSLGVEYAPFDTVISNADIISIHLPLFKETRHLINRETIRKMKDGCLIINTARGGIVCTEDLVAALETGKIAGAACDVHEVEPVPEDYALLGKLNVILTPHVASGTEETTKRMLDASAASIISYYKTGKPEFPVN